MLGLSWTSCRYLSLIICLLVIAWLDSRTLLIPDSLQLVIVLLALLRIPVEGERAIIDALLGSAGVFLPVLLLVLLMNKRLGKEMMGGGDLKLMAGLGLHFGTVGAWQILTLACWLALPVAVWQRKHQQEIPFAPFLAAATIFSIF